MPGLDSIIPGIRLRYSYRNDASKPLNDGTRHSPTFDRKGKTGFSWIK